MCVCQCGVLVGTKVWLRRWSVWEWGLWWGGIMQLHSGTLYLELVRIRDFCSLVWFFYNHILLVKVMNVIIFHCDHTFTFLCGNVGRITLVSTCSYSCGLCRIWVACDDCGCLVWCNGYVLRILILIYSWPGLYMRGYMCGIALYSVLDTEYILTMKINGQCFFPFA